VFKNCILRNIFFTLLVTVKNPNVWECKASYVPVNSVMQAALISLRNDGILGQNAHTDRQTDNLYLSTIKIKGQLLVGSCKNIIK